MKNIEVKKIIVLFLASVLVVFAGCAGNQQQDGGDSSTAGDKSFGEKVDYTITGIEPGAGMSGISENIIGEYNLTGWSYQPSSCSAMLAAMQDAYKHREAIIVTGWEPHSLFALGDMRKLEDPKGMWNKPDETRKWLKEHAPRWADAEVGGDVAATVSYKGFREDAPAAYELLSRFNIPADHQSQWIYAYTIEEREPRDIAREYLSNHPELKDKWMPAGLELGKKSIILAGPAWPGVTVKNEVVSLMLEELGYEVGTKQTDAAIVFTAIADNQMDATLAAWMPNTHKDYYNRYTDDLDVVAVNLNMTWLGWVVPDYVDEDIQSIADLRDV
ncbi:MAG: glycine betaine ABC transporter substrate-binding protein [Candidatus Altiarchaeota archaeon]|nr:glycine betaine ABC transporter substrate-binding protein [Candidatus Altiarchaeota archaeon]